MTAARRPDDSGRSALRYQLPAASGAIWLGLPTSAMLLLAIGIAAAVVALLSGVPVPLAAGFLVLTTLTATVPVAGRTPLGWAPAAAEHTLRRVRRNTGWAAGAHLDESAPPPTASLIASSARRVRLRLPAEYGRLTLTAVQAGGAEPIGVLHGAGRGTGTVVLELVGTDRFALLDPAAQDSQLARWGSCLSALAADPAIARWQWLTHSRTDTHPQLPPTAHGTSAGPADLSDPGAPSGAANPRTGSGVPIELLKADHAQLVDTAAGQALDHRHLLAITLHGPAIGSVSGGATASGLTDRVRDVAALLLGADLLARPLPPDELGTVLRLLTDPALPDRNLPDPTGTVGYVPAEGCADPRSWAIRSRHASWTSCRTDDSWHRSYAVTSWPRLALPADWLAPLLHTPPPAGTARTLAVHAVPVAPQHAARRARAATAKAALDAADRSRLGLTSGGAATAADTLAAADAADLEAELVAGYRLLQLSAFLTVTALDRGRLAAATDALRTLTVTHRLDLRPLHGQHPHGLVATLPLGLLPGGRR